MSKSEMLRYLAKDNRFGGRKHDEFRTIEVEYNVSKTSEGSARVKIGDSEVIAGVKLELGTPFPDTPDEGALMVGTELLPLSSPDFESGPPGIDSIEMARVIDRGIRESKSIDNKKLCIKKGEKVWIVNVDVCTLNDDGNLLDTCGLAAIAALKVAKFPGFDGEKIDYKNPSETSLPMSKFPIPVTVYKVGDKLFVDPDKNEQKQYDSRLTTTTLDDGTICAMQKGGDSPLSVQDIDKMVALAIIKAKEIRKSL